MNEHDVKDTVIKKEKRFLKDINEEGNFVWTRNFRTAMKMTQEEASVLLEKYGESELADAYAAKDVLHEFPFNAVIRVKHQDMVIYVREVTRDKIFFCHLMQNAHHYRDAESAQKTLKKYQKILEENGYLAEVITD